MKKVFYIILMLCCYSKAWADATPKLNDRPELEFLKDGQLITDFDSLLIITHLQDVDTIQYLYPNLYRSDFLQNVLYHNGTNYLIDERSEIDSFQIIIIHRGKKYSSKLISLEGDKSFLKFELIENGTIRDNHNLLYCKWDVYLKSFMITLLMELSLIFLILRKHKKNSLALLITILLVNLLTHFSLWFVDSRINISLILLESIVIIIESLVLTFTFRNQIPINKMILTVFFANIASWWIGSIIHYMIK